MKKTTPFFLALATSLMGLVGCQSDEINPDLLPAADQEYLYYGRYRNSAWTRTDWGFVITPEGRIHKFDVIESGEAWIESDEDGRYAPGDFEANAQLALNENRERVSSRWLNDHPLAISVINEATLFQNPYTSLDAGSIALYVLRKDETGNYHEYLVGARGDWEMARTGELSEYLLDWLHLQFELINY